MNRPSDLVIQRVLNNTASEEQAQQIAAWFATEEGQKWLSEQLEQDAERIADGTISRYEDIPSAELLRRIDRIINHRNRRRMIFRVAAILIPCALILGMWWNMNSRLGGALFSPQKTEQIASACAERKQIIFQDGTKVFLNAGTQITYPEHFGLTERRIQLNGEAYFEVAHNPGRPFIVQIGDASIEVLGTSFNVKAYASEPQIDVVLIEGSVQFSSLTAKYRLEPSQKLIYDKTTGKGEVSVDENLDHETLWHNNIIYFRDTPMQQVITTLERWYDVQFEVSDRALYQSTFTLKTPYIPLAELLTEMQNIAPIKCTTNGKTVLISPSHTPKKLK